MWVVHCKGKLLCVRYFLNARQPIQVVYSLRLSGNFIQDFLITLLGKIGEGFLFNWRIIERGRNFLSGLMGNVT